MVKHWRLKPGALGSIHSDCQFFPSLIFTTYLFKVFTHGGCLDIVLEFSSTAGVGVSFAIRQTPRRGSLVFRSRLPVQWFCCLQYEISPSIVVLLFLFSVRKTKWVQDVVACFQVMPPHPVVSLLEMTPSIVVLLSISLLERIHEALDTLHYVAGEIQV